MTMLPKMKNVKGQKQIHLNSFIVLPNNSNACLKEKSGTFSASSAVSTTSTQGCESTRIESEHTKNREFARMANREH
jgi:hypothetical protein